MAHSKAAETRSVSAFILCEIFGGIARLMIATAVGKQVYDITHHPLDLGWLGLIEFAPSAFLVLLTGSVADRFDRRRIVAYALAFDALGAAALAWNASRHNTSLATIFIAVGVVGTGRAFFTPALRALPTDIVAPDRVPWLTARYSITWQGTMIIGPVIGGFLYALNATAPFSVSVFCYGIAAIVILFATFAHVGTAPMVTDDEPQRGGLHEALEGFRFVKSERVLLGAISLDLFAVLFGGAVALLPAIADDRLHVGALGLGWLRAAVGIGASAVSLVLVFRPLRRHVGRVLLSVVAIFGVFTVVLGFTRNYAIAFVAIMLLSGADAVSVFIRSTLVPLITPRDKRGRVLALESVFVGASNELGAFESGVAAAALGTASAVVVGGVATLAVALLWAVFFPGLRDQDTFPTI